MSLHRVHNKYTHGSLNVPIEHHPTIRYIVYNGYYKVMSNISKMGQLPTPVYTLSQMRNCPLPLAEPKSRGDIGQVTGFLLLLRRGKGKPGTGAVLKLGKVGGNRGKPWSFAVRTLALCSFNFDEYLTGVQFVELKRVFSQIPEIMCEPNMAAVV